MPHIHEKIDFTTEVFIVHKDKVLLRKHDKLGIWLSIGGHVELEDDPVETAHKEVMEEVGLKIKLIDADRNRTHLFSDGTQALLPPRFLNRHRINDTHEHVCMVYFATTDNPNVVIPDDSHETVHEDDWGWFTAEEIQELDDCPENVRYYSLVALEEVKE